jgi:MFS family permease
MLMVNSFAFQQQRGESALATAAQFLPMPLAYLALIPIVRRLENRCGPKPLIVTGLTLMGSGLLLYAVAGPNAELWLLEIGFVLTGAGLAFNTGPAVGLALAEMPPTRAGLASGVVNLARLLGITVGVAALGTVMALYGVRDALLAGGVVELMAVVVVLRWVRREPATAHECKELCNA